MDCNDMHWEKIVWKVSYLSFVFNLTIVIFALLVRKIFLDDRAVNVVVIVFCAIALPVLFCGCVAVVNDWTNMIIFVVAYFFLYIVGFFVVVYCYHSIEKMYEFIDEVMEKNSMYDLVKSADNGTLYENEIKYMCCGIDGPDDYKKNDRILSDTCVLNHFTATIIKPNGCRIHLNKAFRSVAKCYILFLWITWALTTLAGVCFALWLLMAFI